MLYSEEALEVWNSLKERITNKFNCLKQNCQSQLDQIFTNLVSNNKVTVPTNKHFTFEEALVEIVRFRKQYNQEINQLKKENLELRKKLDGYGNDDGSEIEEVD